MSARLYRATGTKRKVFISLGKHLHTISCVNDYFCRSDTTHNIIYQMKNLSTILSTLSLIGVLILAVLFMNKSKTTMPSNTTAGNNSGSTSNAARIAYIDIDTFEANYTVLKNKKEEFKKRQANMEAELQRSANQFQNDLQALQQKASTMTQAEGEAAQKRLGQMQQSFQTRKESMELQFVKDQEAFNTNLHLQLDSFLEEYNNAHHYDYILSYSRANPQIMYADKRLNITQDVIKGMNERAGTVDTKAK